MLGLSGAAGLTRWMSLLLFDVGPIDPLTYGGVAILAAALALLACALPARTAIRSDPVRALRAD